MRPELARSVVSDHCHLRLLSLPELIEPAVDHLVERARALGALPGDREPKVTMALHEALTNSVVHGNLAVPSSLKEQSDDLFALAVAERCADPLYSNRVVDVVMMYDEGGLTWVFTDQGAGFDVAAALDRIDATGDNFSPSGRGMLMIRAFMDDMTYEDGGRRLTVALHAPDGVEKRRASRRAVQTGVTVAPLSAAGVADESAVREVMTRNISASGIAFLDPAEVEADRVEIRIPTASGRTISFPAEVRHRRALGAGAVEVGCRFAADAGVASEPAREVAEFLAELTRDAKPAQERRAAPRLAYASAVLVGREDGTVLRGYSRDLSRSGIAFVTTAALEAEEVLLTLPADGRKTTVRVRARIVRSTRLVEGFYDTAACFVTA